MLRLAHRFESLLKQNKTGMGDQVVETTTAEDGKRYKAV